MKKLTIEKYSNAFPDYNTYYLSQFERIGVLEFSFDDVQEFLNKKGYDLHIKEVRFRDTHETANGRVENKYDSLKTVLVAVPEDTVLPEILPIGGDRDINVTTVFRNLLSKHILL